MQIKVSICGGNNMQMLYRTNTKTEFIPYLTLRIEPARSRISRIPNAPNATPALSKRLCSLYRRSFVAILVLSGPDLSDCDTPTGSLIITIAC